MSQANPALRCSHLPIVLRTSFSRRLLMEEELKFMTRRAQQRLLAGLIQKLHGFFTTPASTLTYCYLLEPSVRKRLNDAFVKV